VSDLTKLRAPRRVLDRVDRKELFVDQNDGRVKQRWLSQGNIIKIRQASAFDAAVFSFTRRQNEEMESYLAKLSVEEAQEYRRRVFRAIGRCLAGPRSGEFLEAVDLSDLPPRLN
jgi:hypothetical protein